MAQLIAIVGMAIDLTILLQYRKRLDRVLFYAILSYFVLPAIYDRDYDFYVWVVTAEYRHCDFRPDYVCYGYD